MLLILNIFLFALGIGLIFKGSDFFVDASVAIGERARLPRLLVGSTIVSLATTSPELVVSISSGLNKVSDLAVGNALGSVAANLGLILALAAIISPLRGLPGKLFGRFQIMLAFLLLLFLISLDTSIPQWRGIILICLGIVYLIIDYARARGNPGLMQEEVTPAESEAPSKSFRSVLLFFFIGFIMVIGGSNMLVYSGTSIAHMLGVSPLFIGLTLVAVGTSLPELATAVTAVRKGVFDLSFGNLIGASALNLTLVTGTAAAIYPLTISRTTQLFTFPFILVLSISLFWYLRAKKQLTRPGALILLAAYLCFVAGLVFLQVS